MNKKYPAISSFTAVRLKKIGGCFIAGRAGRDKNFDFSLQKSISERVTSSGLKDGGGILEY